MYLNCQIWDHPSFLLKLTFSSRKYFNCSFHYSSALDIMYMDKKAFRPLSKPENIVFPGTHQVEK